MKFGPLQYSDPKGIYEEDPATEETRARMEKNLKAKVYREVNRLMSLREWRIIKHGSLPHATCLDVQFSIVTEAEIVAIEKAAARREREALNGRLKDFLDRHID